METFKNIATVVGCISALIFIIATINTKFSDWIKNLFKNKEKEEAQTSKIDTLAEKFDKYIASDEIFKQSLLEDLDVQKDFARDQCRNTIKDIFYKFCETKKIPLYELKIATDTFTTYSKKLKGNHYIALLYNEILKWEIDYTHSFEEDE